MLNYIVDGLRTAHPTVWWTSGVVVVALVIVSGWNAYKSATAKPRASVAIVHLV